MSFFQLENVTFGYDTGSGPVVRDFSLRMEQGEIVGILGSSGCGKSTLLRLIAGLEAPAGGRILIAGKVLVDPRQFVEPEHRGVGMIFQDYALFPHLTVEQNILFGLHRLTKREREQRLGEMLSLVQMEGYGKRYPHELSGGQQQRVAFARALAPRPAILLMDEPFSNLDADLKKKIREDLKQLLRHAHITTILVTHDKEDAETICDRIIRLAR
ncbi:MULTISPECIES: ABC transporter ATP-binding protein [Brevibacillus]|jgi:iron(III) transport system ATP-binding protein|uniref:Carnitine transport ATP-binding protein OpuCA n=1 Tax=Brevibacillus parabrevis TaxID=54914 RepID=A0A4Y3PF35_BREPA|nr:MULTISPECIES: ABC transporter ATP-binding protein [Brevibacillus]MBU8715037.1 ABC transporter ATP-binding protein [Brevibacillus parabrevis]MDH6352359.1 iron(III) transport system ATP-binding protein [Brevibacillus sp. 1238]MDR5000031.1 ABC transporter ATP-binding protein [Brevibacillus parabrevis]MED2255201.1 ABC transporter ATP-binding protein [Brevibacillus parabrevis]NRQ54845.1 ABC transporter ATP-binding protein [Brevibacillus sp. HD1.4A]